MDEGMDAMTLEGVDPEEAASSPIPKTRQFDFWIGDWEVSWGESGRGTNRVQAILDGCVILENFDGAPSIDLRGMSVTAYNPALEKWQQTWVDNQGNYFDFVGGYLDGRMILSRDTVIEGREVTQRMVWYNIRGDELDWNWERSHDGGKTWELLWHIHYRRRG